jgi:predicted nucleotidyltransferase
LEKASEILNTNEFSQKLKQNLEGGITFAAAREKAAKECGLETDILNKPNNNLAVEYINAIKSINSKMQYKTVSRKGAAHDSKDIKAFVSASLLREKLISGDYEFCEKYMSDTNLGLLKSENIANIKNIENMILGILRTKSIYELKKLPDISEGVENKLFSAIKTATSLEELYSLIKVKRYTLSRIRRLVVSAALGMDNSFFMQAPPYIRVLGFNKTGEEILKQSKEKSKIPLILRAKEIEELDESSKKLFDLECRATDLYMLSLNKPRECGFEYKAKLIKG